MCVVVTIPTKVVLSFGEVITLQPIPNRAYLLSSGRAYSISIFNKKRYFKTKTSLTQHNTNIEIGILKKRNVHKTTNKISFPGTISTVILYYCSMIIKKSG